MPTADDIIFNQFYSHASYFFLLLYDRQPNLSVPLQLRHADSLTYIHPFHDLNVCQRHVDDHRQKVITLFTTDRKFLRWHEHPQGLHPNLNKIFIYYDTLEGHMKILRLKGNYSDKIQDVIEIEELEFHLLSAGLVYIRLVCKEFKDDHGVRDQFRADGRRIARAMDDYFGNGATRTSEEVS